MTFVEYVRNIYGPLNAAQITLCGKMEEAYKNGNLEASGLHRSYNYNQTKKLFETWRNQYDSH